MILQIVLICIFAAIAWLFVTIRKRSRLPPGPFPLPVFGNLLSLGDSAHIHISEYMYKHKYKIISMQFGSIPVMFISDEKLMHEAFVTKWETYSSRRVLSTVNSVSTYNHTYEGISGLAFSTDERWKRYRRIIASGLTKTRVRSQKEHLQAELVEFNGQLSQLAKQGLPVEIWYYAKRYTLNVVQRVFFGGCFPYSDECVNERSTKFIKEIAEFFELFGANQFFSDYLPFLSFLERSKLKRFSNVCERLGEIVSEEIESHKLKLDPDNPKDVLDAIILEIMKEGESGLFNPKDLVIISQDIYLAGTDTGSSTLQWFMYFLAKNPQYQDRIYEELSKAIGVHKFPTFSDNSITPLLNATISEVERIRPVTPFSVARSNENDDYLDGYFIPKNTLIFQNIWGYHHDPAVWGDPEVFRPERFLEKKHDMHIFGTGPRSCVGSNLAEEEIYQACALLCQRYQWRYDVPPTKEDFGELRLVIHPKPYKVVISAR